MKDDVSNKFCRITDLAFLLTLITSSLVFTSFLTTGYAKTNAAAQVIQKISEESCEKFKQTEAGSRAILGYKGVEFAFRYCPADSFEMGSPLSESGRDDDEDQHFVRISEGFWICETETTQVQWNAVGIKQGKKFGFNGTKLPVENVTWYECDAFVRKLNDLGTAPEGWCWALPTEEQWEYACRAGTTGATYGESIDECAWYYSNSEKKTHEVGMKKPNDWGIYDMLGNVWEWTGSKYNGESSFVNRGGGWSFGARLCRPANRSRWHPYNAFNYRGFRAVLVRSQSE